MSTLLDLIQTKVNYVVQEAIVVIKDIFRKYPNKYVPAPPSVDDAALLGSGAWGGKAGGAFLSPYFSATNSILKRNPLFFLTAPELPLSSSAPQSKEELKCNR